MFDSADLFPLSIKPDFSLRFFTAEAIWLAGLIVTSIVFLTSFKKYTKVVRKNIKKFPFNSALVGIIGLIILYFLNVLFALTIIGIPLILVLNFGLILAILLGLIAVVWIIGEFLVKIIVKKELSPLILSLVGITILELVKFIPYIGWLPYFIAISLGLGSVVVTRFGTIDHLPGKLGSEKSAKE